jgi:hypothetical protein
MFHLLHDDRPVGWLSGHAIGFFGFADAHEAAIAAWVAYRTARRKVAPLLGVRPPPIDIEPLRIERRAGREVIVATGREIAILVRPGRESPSGPSWYGFEIELSPEIDVRMLRDTMIAASRALLKSGIPWSMVRVGRRVDTDAVYLDTAGSARQGATNPRQGNTPT